MAIKDRNFKKQYSVNEVTELWKGCYNNVHRYCFLGCKELNYKPAIALTLVSHHSYTSQHLSLFI